MIRKSEIKNSFHSGKDPDKWLYMLFAFIVLLFATVMILLCI